MITDWIVISFLNPGGKGVDNVNSYLIWVILSTSSSFLSGTQTYRKLFSDVVSIQAERAEEHVTRVFREWLFQSKLA